MRKITRGLLVSVALGVTVYVLFGAHAQWGKVRQALGDFHWSRFGWALALACVNYLLRYFKWAYYLRKLDIKVPTERSALVFLSGFSLTVTPGKMGEVVKSYLLKESDKIPMTRTAPIVIAERVTDLLSLLLLAAGGVLTYKLGGKMIILGGALVVAFLAVISSEKLMRKILGRFGDAVLELYTSMKTLMSAKALVVATALSVAAWLAECFAFWLIIEGFPGVGASVGMATTIYAGMTIVGALSFIPGGLGVTEAGMAYLLVKLGQNIVEPTAMAATFLVRAATLWFAVLVGLVALVVFQRKSHVRVDIPERAQAA